MKKELGILFFCLMLQVGVQAQVMLRPLQQEWQQAKAATTAATTQHRLLLNPQPLPFFDDFANYRNNVPDELRWINGGTFVNNRYGLDPVSIGVASFDGLNAAGRPYVSGVSTPGPSDTLTSQPILLGALTPADSVYLSFYWQSGGIGDAADITSGNNLYLQLEFRDATGNWVPVWRQVGIDRKNGFEQVFVGLRETRFFHDNFQFRFRNIGTRSGMSDIWNIDYVELDKNRRKNQPTTTDITISRGLSSLLRHYTAMPVHQFAANPEKELAEQVSVTVNNLGTVPAAISWRGYITMAEPDMPVDTFLRDAGIIAAGGRQVPLTGVPQVGAFTFPQQPFSLVHTLFLDTKEQNPLQRANDTTSRTTVFSDYYAYDDGTAEAGFSYLSTTGAAQVAQLYELNQQDQVRAFRVFFPPVGRSIAGTPITFRIWKDEDGKPGESMYEQSFQVRYTEGLNNFYEVVFPKPVTVKERFWAGWTQPGTLFLNIGFDKNEIMPGRRFLFSSLTGWFEDPTAGAVMLRPVMNGKSLGLADEIAKKQAAARFVVYPNPSDGAIYLESPYKSLRVYDATGREVHFQQVQPASQPVLLRHLSAGLYTLRIETSKTIITKKLILTKP